MGVVVEKLERSITTCSFGFIKLDSWFALIKIYRWEVLTKTLLYIYGFI